MPNSSSKRKKRRKKNVWDNDSVGRLQKRIARMEAETAAVREKLERLQEHERSILADYQNRRWGETGSIAEKHGIDPSTLHRLGRRHALAAQIVQLPECVPRISESVPRGVVPMTPNGPAVAGSDGSRVAELEEELEELQAKFDAFRDDSSDYQYYKDELAELREEHSDCPGNEYEFAIMVEDWMARLRSQAKTLRQSDLVVGFELDAKRTATARFLTDLAWDLEKWRE